MAKMKQEVAGGTVERDEAMARLLKIPNIGPRMASALLKLGVTRLEDAAGRDPDEMYYELCAIDATRHDPCVRDVFAAMVFYADGGPARPWWDFTPERKVREAREKRDGKEKA
jgi:pathogenicity locus Cdd1 protein